MPMVAKKLAQVFLPGTLSGIYTTPANTATRITEFWACNTDTVAHTLQICLVPNGGSAAAGNAIVWNMNMLPGAILPLGCNQVLGPGDFIAVQASVANMIAITVAGVELT